MSRTRRRTRQTAPPAASRSTPLDRPWEQAIVSDYAFPAFLVAQQYETVKQYAQARAWYTRALGIDPQHARAREALARLPKT